MLALIAVLASGAAAADGAFSSAPAGARGPTAAAVYFAVPIGARNREEAKPMLGLRVQRLPLTPLESATLGWRAKTIVDVPLRVRGEDPVRDNGSALLLGKGLIVGIVVGAVVAVSVLDDDDDDGGGY
jgi:hypothetical protein